MKEFKFEGYGFSVNKLVPNGDTHIALPMEVIRKACRKSDALSKFMWFNNIRIFDSKPLNIKTLRPVPMYDDEPTAFFDWSMCEDALSYILLLTLNSLCKEKYNQEFFYYAPSRQSSSPDEKVESFILFQAGYPWELSKRFPTSREEVDNLIMDGIHQILGDVVDVEIKEWHIVYSTGLSTVDEERKSEAHSTVNDTKKTDEKFMPAAGVPEEASPAASVSDDDEYQLKFAFYPGELTSLDKLPNNPCCYEVTSDEPITTSDLTSTIRYAIEVNGFDRGKFSCITTEWLNTEVVLKTLWLIHDVHVVRSHVPSQLVQWREDEQPTIFAVNWEKSGFRFHDVANLRVPEVKPPLNKTEAFEIAEKLGWTVSESDDDILFEQYSPAGEDFGFTVNKDEAALVKEVRDYADDFDSDEHIRMWIEANENGVRGVPSIRELVADADAIQDMLNELADALSEADKG